MSATSEKNQMQASFRAALIVGTTLGACLSAPSAIAQCVPAPEGSLPVAGPIVASGLSVNTDRRPITQVPARMLTPIDLTKRTRIPVESILVGSEAQPSPIRTSVLTKVAKQPQFPGPIAIRVSGASLASKVVEQDGRFILVGGADSMTRVCHQLCAVER